MNAPFNTAVTSATLPLIDIKPTLAYKVNDDLSLGVSVDIYTFAGFLGEGQVEQRQVGAGLFGVPAGTSVEFNGKETGAGATVSLLYTPLKNSDGKPMPPSGWSIAPRLSCR